MFCAVMITFSFYCCSLWLYLTLASKLFTDLFTTSNLIMIFSQASVQMAVKKGNASILGLVKLTKYQTNNKNNNNINSSSTTTFPINVLPSDTNNNQQPIQMCGKIISTKTASSIINNNPHQPGGKVSTADTKEDINGGEVNETIVIGKKTIGGIDSRVKYNLDVGETKYEVFKDVSLS